MTNTLLNCYIIHYTKLTDRKTNMLNQINDSKLNDFCKITWLDKYDREIITEYEINKFISPDNNFNTNMAYAANAIAHIQALQIIADSSSYGLILEDDLIFTENFTEKLKECIYNLPVDWDMIFLSEGCDIHPSEIKNEKKLYKVDYSRCSNCYLVSNKGCKKMINTIFPVQVAIDHQYNIEIKRHNLNVYLLEPTIAFEGSKFNIFDTSVIT